MNRAMATPATSRRLTDPIEPAPASRRERLGVAAFVAVAIIATAAWLVLIGWLVAWAARNLF